MRAAEELAVSERVGRLELRCQRDLDVGFERLDLYSTFIRDLPESPGDVLSGCPARADARKAREQHRLTLREGRWYVGTSRGSSTRTSRPSARLLPASFARGCSRPSRAGDDPPHEARRYAHHGGDVVPVPRSGAGTTRGRRPTRTAAAGRAPHLHGATGVVRLRRLRVFDFGRSRNQSGAFAFKAHRAAPAELHYQIRRVRDQAFRA